jgi:hypothetical protein
MWPFKKKEYYLLGMVFRGKPSYFLRGIAAGIEMRKQIGKRPRYTPSKIIQPK